MTNTEIAPLALPAYQVVGPIQHISERPESSTYRQIVMGLQAAVAIFVFSAIVLFSVMPAHASTGMRINPAVELDTTQVQDDRGPSTFYRVAGDGDVPDAVADCLTSKGWAGKDDGMAAIYAPTAVIIKCGGTVSR